MLPSEEIKNKLNIVDLVGEYVPLKKAGVNYRAVCPFHQEKTPSFMVSPTKQIWHCFGCGLGGDIFEFVKQIEGVEFPEALQILAARVGVTLSRPTVEYKKELDEKKTLYSINEWAAKYYAKVLSDSPGAENARAYVQKRGFAPDTVQQWQIGYAPDDFHSFENFIVKKGFQRREAVDAGLLIEKDAGSSSDRAQDRFFDRFRGRLMFPLLDIHGRVVGFTARLLEARRLEGAEGPTQAKYVNSPETPIYSKSHLIYGLNFAKTEIRRQDGVVVVEGNADVITCHEAGFTNVVGSSGTAFTEAQLELLKRFTPNISFAFDVDEAGLTATRRAVELALSQGFNVKIIFIPSGLAKDPDELIRRDPKLWEEQVKSAKNFLDFYFQGIFGNLNPDSSQKKKQAVADLLPLLSLLPDPIDRAHYVKELAFRVGVDEKLILDLLNKRFAAKASASPRAGNRPAAARKTKQEILERRVLSLFLKYGKSITADWDGLGSDDFSVPVLREIYSLAASEVKQTNFDLAQFLEANSKFQPEIELLLFALENELSFDPDVNLEEMKKQFLAELKVETTKRKMQELAHRIQQAEVGGRGEEARSLSSEFNNLTRELAKYHVA